MVKTKINKVKIRNEIKHLNNLVQNYKCDIETIRFINNDIKRLEKLL